MKYLFIGGPKDGERLETRDQPYVKVAIPTPFSQKPKSLTWAFVPIPEFVYQFRAWGCGNQRFYFYTPEGEMADEQLFQTLLDGYNPKKQ